MLNHPVDLKAWREWQSSRNRLRQIRHRIKFDKQSQDLFLYQKSSRVSVLFAVDADSPTAVAAVLKPLEYLGHDDWAVVSSLDISTKSKFLAGVNPIKISSEINQLTDSMQELRAVYSIGHYLSAGFFASELAASRSIQNVVAQHGLITPFAPPLPANSTALVFSPADGDFWTAGRTDIEVIEVGSQLLWQAAQTPSKKKIASKPVFLGQLHGAELPRSISAKSAENFCLTFDASYRPHPYEKDVLSRLQHRLWKARGIDFALDSQTLASVNRPVVSIFSTGVLEAAAAGIPSWVFCDNPPEWLSEFWDRYEMSTWGNAATQRPKVPELMPAKQSAAVLNVLSGKTQ
jgi:hypothetical protein